MVNTTLTLNVRRQSLITVAISGSAPENVIRTVSESDVCGFSLSEPEPGTEYAIRIGDESPDEPFGQDFGHIVSWRQGRYFESARGLVLVQLLSRPLDESISARVRCHFKVNVLPSKLGEEQYNAMFEDLRAVSVGLVFDLLSKSRLNLGMAGIGALSSRPANAELAVLQRLWDSLSLTLQQIAVQPMQGLQQVQENRLCWGSERLSVAGLRQLAMSGVDPRRGGVARPFYAMRERLRETYDIAEHRTILGFLRFITERILDCGWRAEQQIAFIKKDQPYRDVDQSNGSNLFRDIDGPRMQRLQHASARAKDLVERIRQAERIEFLRRIQPELRPPYSPIFANVLPYKRFRDEMLRYLGASLAILDEGLEERAKSTARMYEQWIFLQVLAALRACGLRPISQQGLLTRARRHRFMIDIERGTRVSFLSDNRKNISVRYEPWIHPVALARSSHESVYRGRSGENSWSPDILIEVMEDVGEQERASGVEYAIVIDAKYSAQISPRHKESVSKYNEIRDTSTNRPVVKQVWLAHPGESGITPWDDAIEWTSQGPTRPRNEVINGTLGILPPSSNLAGTQGRPLNETALEFTKGLLAYLGIHAESRLASV